MFGHIIFADLRSLDAVRRGGIGKHRSGRYGRRIHILIPVVERDTRYRAGIQRGNDGLPVPFRAFRKVCVGVPAAEFQPFTGIVCIVYDVDEVLRSFVSAVNDDFDFDWNKARIYGNTLRDAAVFKRIAGSVLRIIPVAEIIIQLCRIFRHLYAAVNDIGFAVRAPLAAVFLHHKGDFEIVFVPAASGKKSDACKKHCHERKCDEQFLFYCCHSYTTPFIKILFVNPARAKRDSRFRN